jgi:hypothetical protein
VAKAEVCKTSIAGSIPAVASVFSQETSSAIDALLESGLRATLEKDFDAAG